MKIWKVVIISGLACFGSFFILRAQTIPAIQQMENSQRQMELQKPQFFNANTNAEAPELYPGENADVGPQRILKMMPRRQLFEVFADSQFLYTKNAYLSDSATNKSSTILVNTFQAAFAPDATPLGSGQFAPAIGFRSQWFNYDLGGDKNLNNLDFNAQTAFANAKYTLNEWQFYGEFDFTRLLTQGNHFDYHEAYREYMPEAGVRRIFVLNDKMAFTANYQIDYHLTQVPSFEVLGPPPSFTDVNDRLDNILSLSLSYLVMPNMVVQPFYRAQYTYYPHFSDNSFNGTILGFDPEKSRNDLLNDIGVTLLYQFTKNFTARIFVDYQVQNSDYKSAVQSVEFHNLNAGAGLTVDVRF